jgi:hypothetical protein
VASEKYPLQAAQRKMLEAVQGKIEEARGSDPWRYEARLSVDQVGTIGEEIGLEELDAVEHRQRPRPRKRSYLAIHFGLTEILLREKATHLIEVGLQRLVLRPLLSQLSLGLGALVLTLSLLHLEKEADDDES